MLHLKKRSMVDNRNNNLLLIEFKKKTFDRNIIKVSKKNK